MFKMKNTILAAWPELKDDLNSFLSDTDAWIISELKKAYQAKDWENIRKIIGVMELVHNMSHQH
jgi:hypothetical protein